VRVAFRTNSRSVSATHCYSGELALSHLIIANEAVSALHVANQTQILDFLSDLRLG